MSLTAKLQKQKTWEETKKYLQAFVQNLHLLSSVTGSREEEKKGGGRLSKKKTQHKKPTTSPPKKKKATSFGLAACIRSSLLS